MKLLLSAVIGFMVSTGMALADPNPKAFENWKTDFDKHAVDLSEIISGGPSRDGIPSIDEPEFAEVEETDRYSDSEPVIALEINGDARAYPLSVLMFHEIANDKVGGKPVAVTYCPLCNAAIVFSAELNGMELDFGTTGRLRHSDLVMYDRQTESWWQQFSGKAIIGELTGEELAMLPSTTMPFSRFRQMHPDGKVLVPSDPDLRNYGENPYVGYDSSARPFLYRGDLPEGIDPMERVIIAGNGEAPVIVTMSLVREAGEIERQGITMKWQSGMVSALDQRVIAESRDTGHVVVTRDGEPVVHHVTFAFVAHAFHPGIGIAKD